MGSLFCNKCWQEQSGHQDCVATACKHLYCIDCARGIFDNDQTCVICQNLLNKRTVKLVKVMQDTSPASGNLTMFGDSVDSIMQTATNAIKFHTAQTELLYQKKIDHKVVRYKKNEQDAKSKFTQMRSQCKQAVAEAQRLQQLAEQTASELQDKYNQKAGQVRKLMEQVEMMSQGNQQLHLSRRGGQLGGNAMMQRPMPSPQMVTTYNRTQVFQQQSPMGALQPVRSFGGSGRNISGSNFLGGHFEEAAGGGGGGFLEGRGFLQQKPSSSVDNSFRRVLALSNMQQRQGGGGGGGGAGMPDFLQQGGMAGRQGRVGGGGGGYAGGGYAGGG